MKKNCLLLFLFLIPLLLFAGNMDIEQTDSNISFADSNVKALCVANWDTNHDGELSYAEAAVVTYLGEVFKSNKLITSFNELQYFTGLTNINGWAFYDCSELTSVIIPASVTSIKYNAFQQTGLTSIDIPAAVTEIGNAAFYGCPNLSRVSLPDGLTSIGHYAFEVCSNLESLNIPKNISEIGNYAFRSCSHLKNIKINVENPFAFGTDAFWGISSDCVLYVPAGTRSAYIASGWTEYIFKGGVIDLSSNIDFADSNVKALCVANWDTNNDGGLSYDEAAAVTYLGEVFKSNKLITSFNELQYFTGLTNINGWAFYDCSELTSVIIPASVTSIKYNAFQQTGLTSIDIPAAVTEIGNAAFCGCPNLSRVSLPDGLTSIGHYAFEVCSNLEFLNIPKNISEIGNYAFRACSNLKNFKINGENPFTFGTDAFWGISSSCVLTVPAGTRDAYIAAGWTENVFKGGVGEDVSNLLENPYFRDGFTGWTHNTGTTGGLNDFPCVEIFGNPVDVYQTVTNVPVGVYAISVKAFERVANNGSYNGTESSKVYLYMNQFETPVQNIAKDAIPESEAVDLVNCFIRGGNPPEPFANTGGTTNADVLFEGAENSGYIPNGMSGASYAFRAGRYEQKCFGLVGEDGVMNIGLTSKGERCHWVLWADFKLTFMGKSETALASVIEYYADLASQITDAGSPDILTLNDAINRAQAATDGETMYTELFNIVEAYNVALESQRAYPGAIYSYEKLRQTATDYSDTASADALNAANYLLESYAGICVYDYACVDLEDMIVEMDRAIARLKLPDYSETPCDFTMMIENPSFETGDLSGWKYSHSSDVDAKNVSDPVYVVTNADGQYVFNTWSSNAPDEGFWLSQTLFGLPAGQYKLEALMSSDVDNVIILSANDTADEFTMENSKERGQDGSVSFTLTEETDVVIKMFSASWFRADNFRLTFMESLTKKGDVNGDGRINGLDIVEMVDKILDRPATGTFIFAAGDFDGNGVINGMDLVKEVALVLSQTASGAKARKAPERLNSDVSSTMIMRKNNDGGISVGVESADRYILSQFVVELSEGQQLMDITSADRDHVVAYQPIDGNRYMVICYSTSNATFTDNSDLLRISCDGEGIIKVTDAMLVDEDRQPHYISGSEFGEATGIELVNADGSFSKPADIYSVSGALVKKNASSVNGLGKGIYVVDGKTIITK